MPLAEVNGNASKLSPGADDFEAWVAHRQAETGLVREEQGGGQSKKWGQFKADEEKLDGINPKTGKRNRCYPRDSENRLLPRCPLRGRQSAGPASSLHSPRMESRPPYSSISNAKERAPCLGSISISVDPIARYFGGPHRPVYRFGGIGYGSHDQSGLLQVA